MQKSDEESQSLLKHEVNAHFEEAKRLFELNQYHAAIVEFELANSIFYKFEETNDRNQIAVANIQNWIGHSHAQMEKFESAVKNFKRCEEIFINVDSHLEQDKLGLRLRNLTDLAFYSLEIGNTSGAIEVCISGRKVRVSKTDTDDNKILYIEFLIIQSKCYFETFKFRRASKMLMRAIEMCQILAIEDDNQKHLQIAKNNNLLAYLHLVESDLTNAIRFGQKAEETFKDKTDWLRSRDTFKQRIDNLLLLADCYEENGEYAKAIDTYKFVSSLLTIVHEEIALDFVDLDEELEGIIFQLVEKINKPTTLGKATPQIVAFVIFVVLFPPIMLVQILYGFGMPRLLGVTIVLSNFSAISLFTPWIIFSFTRLYSLNFDHRLNRLRVHIAEKTPVHNMYYGQLPYIIGSNTKMLERVFTISIRTGCVLLLAALIMNYISVFGGTEIEETTLLVRFFVHQLFVIILWLHVRWFFLEQGENGLRPKRTIRFTHQQFPTEVLASFDRSVGANNKTRVRKLVFKIMLKQLLCTLVYTILIVTIWANLLRLIE